MSTISVTRPDSRVNLGGGDTSRQKLDAGYGFKLTIPLSAAHWRAIVGDGPHDLHEERRLVDEWITDFLSPRIEEMGRELDRRAAGRTACDRCGGTLIGSELEYGTCGQCGGRAVRL